MKKKDVFVILIILGLAASLFAGIKIFESLNKKEEFGKVIYRNQIDKGDYHKEIRNIKENLASDTYSNVIIKSVYNLLGQ